jgi:2-hydroxychromene-2-carboxylate isomerase
MADEYPPPRRPGGNRPSGPNPSFPEAGPAPAVDPDGELFGAGAQVAQLVARLAAIQPQAAHPAADGELLLSPPFSATRDHVEGVVSGRPRLVVFGAYGTPSSRPLAKLLDEVVRRNAGRIGIAWRHFPDPAAHRRATVLALAAEAAASLDRFWGLHRQLLALRHDDPLDLDRAFVRAYLDPAHLFGLMHDGVGADRIVEDVASAAASGVVATPTLFVNGERYRGAMEAGAISDALAAPVATD